MVGILNIQISSTSGKIDVNLNKIEHFIKRNIDKKLDLVVMPEFFANGVNYENLKNFSVPEDGGEIVEKIKKIAKKYHTNIIAGTVIEQVQDKFYNTTYAINREGEIVGKYRKIHLFQYLGGEEGQILASGENEVTVNFDFGKIGLAIGFDIRFPQLFRKLTQMGAEIIVIPSSWLIPCDIYEDKYALEYAQDMWISMNRVRAYDNGVFVVVSNQIGKINSEFGSIGNSLIISPTAQILANAKEKQCAIYTDIDIDMVKYLKSIYPIAWID